MASESGRFANLTQDEFQKIIDNKDSKQKYLWGIVKQIQHGLFREVVKIPGPLRREVASRIKHLGTSNFYYFPQYYVVFVYYYMRSQRSI